MHIGRHEGSSPNQPTRNSILFTHRSILKSPFSNSLLITKKASGRWRPPSESSPGKPVIYYSISVWVLGGFFFGLFFNVSKQKFGLMNEHNDETALFCFFFPPDESLRQISLWLRMTQTSVGNFSARAIFFLSRITHL